MEPLDLPVRLRPIRARPFVCDAQPNAGIAPGERSVGRPVVRQHALDSDAALGEPGDRALENTDRGDRPLIGADLGVCDAGVVVDDGVDVSGADVRLVTGVTLARPFRRSLAVPVALLLADESPAASVGDVAELRHVDMDQRSRIGVLVTPERLAGDAVDV